MSPIEKRRKLNGRTDEVEAEGLGQVPANRRLAVRINTSCSRVGWYKHFLDPRTLEGEAGRSMSLGQRCVTMRGTQPTFHSTPNQHFTSEGANPGALWEALLSRTNLPSSILRLLLIWGFDYFTSYL